MRTYRNPILICAFMLGLAVLAGCSCGTPRAPCPPPARVAVYTPPVAEVQMAKAPPVQPAPRPSQGVCWVEPLNQQINLGMPPTVTLDQNGRVISSTPAGRVQPPAAPDLAFGYPR